MNSQTQISGYLAPNGYFYSAPYWCHMNTASKIVRELNLHKTHKYDLDEDILLVNNPRSFSFGDFLRTIFKVKNVYNIIK